VLAVPAARQHFSWRVGKGFRRKLPSVKARSNQPALWTSCRSEAINTPCGQRALYLTPTQAVMCLGDLRTTHVLYPSNPKDPAAWQLGCSLDMTVAWQLLLSLTSTSSFSLYSVNENDVIFVWLPVTCWGTPVALRVTVPDLHLLWSVMCMPNWRIRYDEVQSVPFVQLKVCTFLSSISGLHLDRRLTWHKHIFAKWKQLGITLTKMYWLLGRSQNPLRATSFSYIKQYSNQFGLTEYNCRVRLPLPT
jgi:hypothetical protein